MGLVMGPAVPAMKTSRKGDVTLRRALDARELSAVKRHSTLNSAPESEDVSREFAVTCGRKRRMQSCSLEVVLWQAILLTLSSDSQIDDAMKLRELANLRVQADCGPRLRNLNGWS